MPKQSKVQSSRPGAAAPIKERQPGHFYCTRCERDFVRQRGNFPGSQSLLYRNNGGYLPICKHCVDELFAHYKEVLGDEKAALRRICMKFDIYWSEQVYKMLYKANTTTSRVLAYISRSNLIPFVGKTFDDTLDEEDALGRTYTAPNASGVGLTDVQPDSEFDNDSPDRVPEETIEFWGLGFTPSFYRELESRFKYWRGDADRDSMDVSDCAFIRQICMLEVTITRDMAAGKSTDRSVAVLNNLLGSANLKPIQKRQEEGRDAEMEKTPFGVWIRKIENTRPISAPSEEFEDVDGIIRYISTWFFGHLCSVLKIKNSFSRRYEEEMARLRVDRPEYEGEDDEAVFEDIFGRVEADDYEGGEDMYGG